MSNAEYLEEEINEVETPQDAQFIASPATKTTRLLYPPFASPAYPSPVDEPQELQAPPQDEMPDEIPGGSFDQPDEEWLVDRLQQIELDAHSNFNYVQNGQSNLSLRLAFEKAITIYNEIIGVLLQAHGNHFNDWEAAVEDEGIRPGLECASYSIAEMVERLDLILFARTLEITDFLNKVLCREELILFTSLPSIKKDMEIIRELLHARTGDSATMQHAVVMLRPRLSRRTPDHPVGAHTTSVPLPPPKDPMLIAPAISYQSILAEKKQPDPACASIAAKIRLLLKWLFPHHRVHPLKTSYYKSPGGKALCFRSIHAAEVRNKPIHSMIKSQFCDAMPHVCSTLRTLWGTVFVVRSAREAKPHLPPKAAPLNRMRRLMLLD